MSSGNGHATNGAGTNGSAPQPFVVPIESQRFSHDDEDVVVVIGSGAGGGTLANELCQQGVRVVVLEAGPHLTAADYHNDEWPAFNQMAWLDHRTTSGSWRIVKDFPNLPAWTVKAKFVTTFYDDREVWGLLGYEVDSFAQGGYLHRGFDDLDWLPAARIEGPAA